MRRRRRGLSFIEVLMAIAVLTFGIIPMLVSIQRRTRLTRISLRQVQAANHASNLMEALRSLGYPGLRAMPTAKVQLRGNDGRWDTASDGMGLGLEGIIDDGLGDEAVFEDWRGRFFGEPPVVPPLESLFTRYFYLHREAEMPYITIVVRVEWPARVVDKRSGTASVSNRHVEVRTLVADPYRGGSG